jgi:4-hydroxy-4-methyl-2-oxoglutarate aldolase
MPEQPTRTLRDAQAALPEWAARLSEAQFAELRAIDSPTIANAIEHFKARPRVQGYMGAQVRCLLPGLGTLLGYAVTCRGDSTTEGKDRREHTEVYRAIHAIQPLPAVVVIGDDGDPSRIDLSCHAGEMMATTMKRVGALGLITDGGLRDIHEIRALGGFHYFGRGLVVAHGQPCIYDVGATVNIAGMEVRHGDLLHGDENGVTVIPASIADKVAAQAMKVREMEQARLKEILGPDFHRQFEQATQYR